jgi:hypothetical protein
MSAAKPKKTKAEKTTEIAPSLRRRKRIAKHRAEADARDQAIVKNFVAAISEFDNSLSDTVITLPSNVKRALIRKLKGGATKRGPPTQLRAFYEAMAAHGLWQSKGGEKVSVMLLIVSKAWGVSETTVKQVMRDHKVGGRRLLDTLGSNDEVIKIHIEDAARKFRELGT